MMPITVLKVRFESNLYAYRSLWSAAKSIYLTDGGMRGFFAGFGATAVRDAPYAGLYVLFYEQSKRRLSSLVTSLKEVDMDAQRQFKTSTAATVNFASGVLAAGSATALTNPFDAVKTRIQLMPGKYVNTFHAARRMIKEEGIRSMFDGLGLRMARKALSSALAWTVYEEAIRRAELRWKELA
jgi:solute carrier family 25, member 38